MNWIVIIYWSKSRIYIKNSPSVLFLNKGTFIVYKRLTSLNLSRTKLEEPYTRPPSCATPWQPTIYDEIWFCTFSNRLDFPYSSSVTLINPDYLLFLNVLACTDHLFKVLLLNTLYKCHQFLSISYWSKQWIFTTTTTTNKFF